MESILGWLISDDFEVATEAGENDITEQVNDMVNGVMGRGGSASGRRTNPPGFDGKRDINQTDDIFGTQGGDDNGGDEAEDTGDNEGGGDETVAEDNGEGGDEATPGEEENPEDSGGDLSSPMADRNIYKKNRLRDNMIYFHNIMSNNIDALTSSTSNINDPRTLEVMNMVIGNMRDADDQLYHMISIDLPKQPYEELLRKYIALRRVYDIGVEMLEKHFSNVKLKIGIKKTNSRAKIKA